MEQALLAVIGFALAVPSTIVALIELRKTRTRGRRDRARERAVRIRHAPLLFGIGAAGVASLVVSVLIHVAPPKPSTCAASPRATQVSATMSSSDLDIAVHISCAPPDDYQYVLIGEHRDVDVDPTNPHPEYYLTWKMGRPGPGDYQHRFNAKNIRSTVVTYYIISLDGNGFAQLLAQRSAGNFVLSLPGSHTVVSNREVVKPQG